MALQIGIESATATSITTKAKPRMLSEVAAAPASRRWPEVPAEIRRLHRSLSPHAEQLLDLAGADPERCRPEDFSDYGLPAFVTALFPYPVQVWPTLVGGAKLAEMRRATLAVPRLLRLLPERVFDNDALRIARFFDNDPEFIRYVLQPPTGLEAVLGRGDFFDTPDGFKCLEFNCSPQIGGWHFRVYVERLFGKPWLRDLLGRAGAPARYTDPLEELFHHLADQAAHSAVGDGREFNVAFLLQSPAAVAVSRELIEYLQHAYREFRRRNPPLAGELLSFSYDRLRFEARQTTGDGRRLHALIEYHEPGTHPVVLDSFKARKINLYNGPVALMLTDKRGLALLSQHQESGRFSAAERAAIRAYIPWTRITRPGATDYHGERVSLVDFALAHRESLVVKHAMGISGDSVHVGQLTPRAQWESVMRTAFADGRWILQERQESLPYWYPDAESEVRPHDVVWGLYAFGDRYGGGFLRMQPCGRSGVINSSRGACQGIFLEIEGTDDGDDETRVRSGSTPER
jgi:hypothetical protein